VRLLLRLDRYMSYVTWIAAAPAAPTQVEEMLQQGGWGCAEGGRLGIFTPMWIMVGRKPL
jgi:sterol 24-C-methyltransferase